MIRCGVDMSALDTWFRLYVTCLAETFAVAVKIDLLMPLVTYAASKDNYQIVIGAFKRGEAPLS